MYLSRPIRVVQSDCKVEPLSLQKVERSLFWRSVPAPEVALPCERLPSLESARLFR